MYICLKWTRAFNTVLTKDTYQVKWSAFITCLDRRHRDVCLWHLVPSLSSPPFPFFFSCYQLITLLSCCWDVYIFSRLLRSFHCLKFPRILSHGICRWAWYFFTYITTKCWSTENVLWFKLNCRNVSEVEESKKCYENKKS